MSQLELWIFGNKITEVFIFIIFCQRYILSTGFIIVDVDRDHLTEVVLSGFSIVKLLSSLFPYCSLWVEVTMHSPHFCRGRYVLPLWEYIFYISYLKFFEWEICLSLPHLFNNLFISVWSHEYLFYVLKSNTFIFYLLIYITLVYTKRSSRIINSDPFEKYI